MFYRDISRCTQDTTQSGKRPSSSLLHRLNLPEKCNDWAIEWQENKAIRVIPDLRTVRCLAVIFQLRIWPPTPLAHYATASKFVEGTSTCYVPEQLWRMFRSILEIPRVTYQKEIPDPWRSTDQTCALPLDVRVPVDLCFYGSGSFQFVVGDGGHLSQELTPRIVNSVSQTIVLVSKENVYFPTTPPAAAY